MMTRKTLLMTFLIFYVIFILICGVYLKYYGDKTIEGEYSAIIEPEENNEYHVIIPVISNKDGVDVSGNCEYNIYKEEGHSFISIFSNKTITVKAIFKDKFNHYWNDFNYNNYDIDNNNSAMFYHNNSNPIKIQIDYEYSIDRTVKPEQYHIILNNTENENNGTWQPFSDVRLMFSHGDTFNSYEDPILHIAIFLIPSLIITIIVVVIFEYHRRKGK